MLQGVERLISLVDTRTSAITGASADQIGTAIHQGDISSLESTDGHFAGVRRDGQTVRLARTIGLPLRYFVAKMFHGPFLVVGERIDDLYNWCHANKIAWQFDPIYTRMVPAHYLIELDQIGCPDPSPRYRRFFSPSADDGSDDIDVLGAQYVGAAFQSLHRWISSLPAESDIAVAFSGGVDSTSVVLLALKSLQMLGRGRERLRLFTLDMGGGKDAAQAELVIDELGLRNNWESVTPTNEQVDLVDAISVIEDYQPLDVECAAASISLLREVRRRYPDLKYLIDGDGGDENLKSYPLEDSDLTLSSILKNPLLYQEGWGVDAIKHSSTYTGGLSRSYVRTYAPAKKYGFDAFSPYTDRSVIARAVSIPFGRILDGSVERLYSLKSEVVQAGVRAITGVTMPLFPKRRFQDGVGGRGHQNRRVSKAWCRQVFRHQWEERLHAAWNPDAERVSGNDETIAAPMIAE